MALSEPRNGKSVIYAPVGNTFEGENETSIKRTINWLQKGEQLEQEHVGKVKEQANTARHLTGYGGQAGSGPGYQPPL